VGVATGAYGLSFGALSVAAGFSVLQTQVLSLLLFTGGSQFAVAGVIGAGGSGVSAVATSTMLGVRNGLYGLETSRMLQVRGWRRLLAAHLTIDESTAVGMSQQHPDERRLGFWTAGIAVFVLWNLMTLLGAGIGNALGDPTRWGLDAAAAAAFIALLWPRLRSRDARATGVLAGLIALVLAPVTKPGVPVLVAVVAAVIVGLLGAGSRRKVA
jgi:4-azaleucine resistance transporter AzlC